MFYLYVFIMSCGNICCYRGKMMNLMVYLHFAEGNMWNTARYEITSILTGIIFAFQPHPKLGYLPWEGCDENADCSPRAKRYRFCRTTLSGSNIGLARRRVGRGGRWAHVIWPCASHDPGWWHRVMWDYVTFSSNRTASGASSDEEANSEVKTTEATTTNKK